MNRRTVHRSEIRTVAGAVTRPVPVDAVAPAVAPAVAVAVVSSVPFREWGVRSGERAPLFMTKHNHARRGRQTGEYWSWCSMIQRCTNPRARSYKDYGGRGIRICPRWRKSFVLFLADMGPRPKGATLDRFPDNDGDYRPGNCRWATPKQQRQNSRELFPRYSFSHPDRLDPRCVECRKLVERTGALVLACIARIRDH